MHGGGERANGYAARHSPPLKRLSSRIRISCSDQLADSLIPCGYTVRSKKALLKEQISAQRCCKCRAVIVRCAGIPCTLMTWVSRLGKSHCDAALSGADCSHCERFQSCLSALAVSFLFRERLHPSHPPVFLLPGICEKKQRAEDLSGRWQGSSRCLNTRVPRRHRRGRESRYHWTTPQAASIVSLNTPLSAGRRGKCVHDPHRLTLTPRFPTTVIGGQNKTHTFSNIFLPTINILLLCSQSAQSFQPLATRAPGLAGHSRCVNMSNDYGKMRLYTS